MSVAIDALLLSVAIEPSSETTPDTGGQREEIERLHAQLTELDALRARGFACPHCQQPISVCILRGEP